MVKAVKTKDRSLFGQGLTDQLFDKSVVPVLVPLPVERAYSYALPEGVKAPPGSIVQVPLGPRQVAGVVWDGPSDGVEAKKLREVTHVFDCPPLKPELRRFIDWVADYTLSPPGLVARMALRASRRRAPSPLASPTPGAASLRQLRRRRSGRARVSPMRRASRPPSSMG